MSLSCGRSSHLGKSLMREGESDRETEREGSQLKGHASDVATNCANTVGNYGKSLNMEPPP